MNGLNIGRRFLLLALAVALAVAVVLTMSSGASSPFDGMNTGHKTDHPKPAPSAPACGLEGKYNKHPSNTCSK